jgi:hypothetical protein
VNCDFVTIVVVRGSWNWTVNLVMIITLVVGLALCA